MISRLVGQLIECIQQQVWVDVMGVGYALDISSATAKHMPSPGQSVTLYVHTMLRQDTFFLYGFSSKAEKMLFTRLITVSGIGPKLALGLLAMPIEKLVHHVLDDDWQAMTQLPGVGKKTAQRLIVELKDYFATSYATWVDEYDVSEQRPALTDAIHVLVALGYKLVQVQKVIRSIDHGHEDHETLIREALQHLSHLA